MAMINELKQWSVSFELRNRTENLDTGFYLWYSKLQRYIVHIAEHEELKFVGYF